MEKERKEAVRAKKKKSSKIETKKIRGKEMEEREKSTLDLKLQKRTYYPDLEINLCEDITTTNS
jgi:hypothetical protein